MLVTLRNMEDIVNVCRDLIVIDHGNIVYEGTMYEVAVDIHDRRQFIDVELAEQVEISDERIHMISDNGRKKSFVVDLEEVSIDEVMRVLAGKSRIENIKISSTPIEDIIKEIYNKN